MILLSPTKTMGFVEEIDGNVPLFIEHSSQIMDELKKMTLENVQEKFKLKGKPLAQTHDYYQQWGTGAYRNIAIQAYQGIGYRKFMYEQLSTEEKEFAHTHLYILSAMYGILRCDDLIEAYRLDFQMDYSKYHFWKDKITLTINTIDPQIIVSLLSSEFEKVLDFENINAPIYHVEFYTGIKKAPSAIVKQARALLARELITAKMIDLNTIQKAEPLEFKFDYINDETNTIYFRRD